MRAADSRFVVVSTMRAHTVTLTVLLAVAAWSGFAAGKGLSPAANDRFGSRAIKPDREFSADSYVHRPLAPDAEIDPKSDIWVRDIERQIKTFFGTASVNIDKYSPPLFSVGANQPTVRVELARPEEPGWSFAPLQRQFEAVPIPENFAPSPGTDGEAIVYQPSSGAYWEFWRLEKTGRKTTNSQGRLVDEWRAAWGGHIADLRTNPGYFATSREGYKFGTAATGLVLLAGLITIEEQRRGVINHALHFSIPQTREASVWAHPAQRSDGHLQDQDAIPEGATFRLPADLNLDAIDMDPYARMLAKAVQKHGMVLRDVSGAVNFYAENPTSLYQQDPYYGSGGILRCPRAAYDWSCSPVSRLRGFPWDKLQALRARLNG